MRRSHIRGQASRREDNLWRERTRERGCRGGPGWRKEDIWKRRTARVWKASGKCLLKYSVFDAQRVVGAVGGFSIEHAVACAKNCVLGELPGHTKPRSEIVLVDVKGRLIESQQRCRRIGLGRRGNMLQVVTDAKIQREAWSNLPRIFEIGPKVIVVEIIFSGMSDW